MSNDIYKGSKRMNVRKRALFAAALGLATSVAFPAIAQQGPNDRRPLPGAPNHGERGPTDVRPLPPHEDKDRPDRDHSARPDLRGPGGDVNHPPPSGHRLADLRRERERRFKELKEREAKHLLSAAEKTELKQVAVVRTFGERLAELEQKADADRDQRRAQSLERIRGEFGGKLPGDGDTLAEFRNFSDHMAKLDRAREIAVIQARADLIKRIDAMLAAEQKRHDDWVARRKESK